MNIKPWKKVGEPHVFPKKHNRGIITQKFINPLNGKTEEFSAFSGQWTAVIIFPITVDNKVLAIRQFRHAADKVCIELPGGNKKPKETFFNAANRELLEETGFRPKKITRLKTKGVWFDPSCVSNFYIPCLATDCYQVSKPKLDESELLETIIVPLNKWLEMIRQGKICDNKTLATTFLVLTHLKNLENKKATF